MKDVEYARADGKPLLLDIYVQQGTEESLPVVVWIHGGAWKGGDKGFCPGLFLAQRGYAAVSINYRLSGEAKFPAQLYDCKAAIRWIRANAAKYNFDPKRIAVWGGSAGGHLAALLGTTGGVKELEGDLGNPLVSSRVSAVIDWYGPSDFLQLQAGTAGKGRTNHDAADSPASLLIGGPVQENKDKAAQANPITYIAGAKRLPPFLLMHGDQDFTVPMNQSELLCEALKKAGADVRLEVIRGAGHGFSTSADGRPQREQMVAEFLDKHLKGAAPGGEEAPAKIRATLLWVDPPKELPPGVKHETFRSQSMNTDVGYLIYLPSGYEAAAQRYPVLYWLHGLNGSESKWPDLTRKFAKAIEEKKVPPMILVMPNGGQGTFYCDNPAGEHRTETMIIRELIPHIDGAYRTIAGREGRVLEGFSMGGYGTLHLAMKYPEMFCSAAAGAAALLDVDQLKSDKFGEIYIRAFNSDPAAVKANDPFELLKNNAAKVRSNTQVMIFVGTADNFLKCDERFFAAMKDADVPCRMLKLEGVGHNRPACYEAFFDQIMAFHLQALKVDGWQASQPATASAQGQ